MAESKDAQTGTERHPTSAEIRSEIERTRAEMDQTFDALERKMTPGQILEEAWHLTRGGTRVGASKLWQVAREHPLPATVIGLGLGWLLVESSRGDGRERSSRVLREKASALGERSREKATEIGHRTRYQARRAQRSFWELMEENPLAVGVATLGLGVLAGLSLPSTRREDEILGERRDRLVDRLEEAGREALDKGKQVASTTVDTLKEEVQSAGLTPSGLAEKVREVGRHTKEAVKEEVKSQGLTGGVTTPSAPTGTGSTLGTGATGTGGASGTSDFSGSHGRTTPRETITPVEQPELSNKR